MKFSSVSNELLSKCENIIKGNYLFCLKNKPLKWIYWFERDLLINLTRKNQTVTLLLAIVTGLCQRLASSSLGSGATGALSEMAAEMLRFDLSSPRKTGGTARTCLFVDCSHSCLLDGCWWHQVLVSPYSGLRVTWRSHFLLPLGELEWSCLLQSPWAGLRLSEK